MDYEELKRSHAAQLPLRRVAQPEDISGVITFLCSDDAGFITGQTIYAIGRP
jgi:3-oxoacyl-[acyl-carrier protein] reductase